MKVCLIFRYSNPILMDLFFPLSESHNDHIELKYCLRSVQKYLSDVGKVFVVGANPSWIKDIEHSPFPDVEGARYRENNIFHKTKAGCLIPEMSDDFLFMNDDIFLLTGFKASQYPNLYSGNLHETMRSRHVRDPYQQTVIQTMSFLMSMRLTTNDYDIHCPIIYNKAKYLKSVGSLKWDRAFGFCIKSLYGNMNKIGGTEYPDLKLRRMLMRDAIRKEIRGRDFFSTDERYVNNDLIDMLNSLYPKKSKWEL